MKQIAACLLVAVGIGSAGYRADKALVPLVTWFLGITPPCRTLPRISSQTGISRNHAFPSSALVSARKWRISHENADISTRMFVYDQQSHLAIPPFYRGPFSDRTSALRGPCIGDLFLRRVLRAFKVAHLLWRWSGKAALAIVRIFQPHQCPPIF